MSADTGLVVLSFLHALLALYWALMKKYDRASYLILFAIWLLMTRKL
jgi:hypothetical protein